MRALLMLVKRNNKYLCTLCVALVSQNALAFTESDQTVKRIGVQGSSFYFSTNEGIESSCNHGVIYFDNSSDFGKGAYATLLAAKSSGRKIYRLVYNQDASNKCTLSLVEIDE